MLMASSPRQQQIEYFVKELKIPSDEAERLVENLTPGGPEDCRGGHSE